MVWIFSLVIQKKLNSNILGSTIINKIIEEKTKGDAWTSKWKKKSKIGY